MGQINVTINGQDYKLACRDGEEERLSSLANYLNDKTKSLVESLGQVGENRLLLMTALLVADELADAEEKIDALSNGDSKAVKEAVNTRLAKILDGASDKLEGIADQLEA
jgi:cell division protein ZapA